MLRRDLPLGMGNDALTPIMVLCEYNYMEQTNQNHRVLTAYQADTQDK